MHVYNCLHRAYVVVVRPFKYIFLNLAHFATKVLSYRSKPMLGFHQGRLSILFYSLQKAGRGDGPVQILVASASPFTNCSLVCAATPNESVMK